jgi:serine/threonine-protein kinase
MALSSRSHISAPPDTLIGGRYRVIEELGRGGTAVVYRVHDVGTGRELALKQWLVENAAALFEREYYALAQLTHPRVIAVYDYGLDAAGRFYTMELLDGGDLARLSPMPAQRACELMLDVCSSLALLHSRRLVHRDVTPRNVRCTRDGHAKLIDFGAMAPMGPCTQVAGTPAFIAPEVMQMVSIDGRADLFFARSHAVLHAHRQAAVRRASSLGATRSLRA